VAFLADGTVIATAGHMTINLWDAVTGFCKCTLTVDIAINNSVALNPVRAVAFSPDGSKIAAAHSNKIQLFDAQTQAKLGSPLSGHRYTLFLSTNKFTYFTSKFTYFT
jgi:WD40 repeat protein